MSNLNDPNNGASNNSGLDRKQRLARARKALKKKIKTVDDDIRKDLAKTRYARLKKQKAQNTRKNALIALGALVFIGLVMWVFAPKKGGDMFALCKTFIELRVEYPPELRYTYARRFPNKMRVWYVHHDSFGQKQIEKMDCFFARNAQGQIYMQKAEFNRGDVDEDAIKRFNASIPAILKYPPDLTLPRGLPDDLKRFYKAGEG